MSANNQQQHSSPGGGGNNNYREQDWTGQDRSYGGRKNRGRGGRKNRSCLDRGDGDRSSFDRSGGDRSSFDRNSADRCNFDRSGGDRNSFDRSGGSRNPFQRYDRPERYHSGCQSNNQQNYGRFHKFRDNDGRKQSYENYTQTPQQIEKETQPQKETKKRKRKGKRNPFAEPVGSTSQSQRENEMCDKGHNEVKDDKAKNEDLNKTEKEHKQNVDNSNLVRDTKVAENCNKKPETSSISTSSSNGEPENKKLTNLKKEAVPHLFTKKVKRCTTEPEPPETPPPRIVIKKEVKKGTSSTSSSSSSSSSDAVKSKFIKKNKRSEDEVVCLGDLQRVENLVDGESDDGNTKNDNTTMKCELCDEEGHISFTCFMICKNCGGKHHGLKDCPKPANLSTVLQNFMEFCLNQCRQYNPEQAFYFKSQVDLNSACLKQTYNKYIEKSTRRSNTRSSPVKSKSSRRRKQSSSISSDSSHKEITFKKRKVSKKTSNDQGNNSSINQFPFNPAFSATTPFTINPQGMPFAQGVHFNPMLAFSHMMGLNSFNSANSTFEQ